MIRTVRIPQNIPRIGATADPGCPWYNPFCWFVPADDPSACYGGGPLADTAACVAANNAGAAAYLQTNPALASDLTDASTANVVGLANPFTGTGPLTSAGFGIPAWVWLAGGGIVALTMLKR